MNPYSFYLENIEDSKKYRIEQMNEAKELITELQQNSSNEASKFFVPDFSSETEYKNRMDSYRKLFCEMLGWPLYEEKLSKVEITNEIAESVIYIDSNKTVKRLKIAIAKNISLSGILIVPTGTDENTPLVFALHGAKGCPELACGLYGSSANYNDMVMRAVNKGFIVFVPQLHLWSEEYGPKNQREAIDQKLKLLGGSITSLEIFKIKKALTALILNKYTGDSAAKGVMGLSYGGMYALYVGALDTRFTAVLSSGWLNEHPYEEGHTDWVHGNSENTFRDEQIAAMICPRTLYIDNGKYDKRFPPIKAQEKAEYINRIYKKLNKSDRFKYQITNEGHAFDSNDDGLSWLKFHLKENYEENAVSCKENSVVGV